MGAAIDDRRSGFLPRAVCGVLLGVCVGCVTGNTATPDLQVDFAVLSGVSVEQDQDNAVVTLAGVGDALYGVERDGQTLSVELAGVRPGGLADSIRLGEGIVQDLAVEGLIDAEGWPSTHVEFSFASHFDFEVIDRGDSLEVRVFAQDATWWTDSSQEATPEVPEAGFEEAMEEAAREAEEMELAEQAEPADQAAPPATALLDVQPAGGPGATFVRLVMDGRVAEAESFVLDDPDRLVVDLPGLQSQTRQTQFPVESTRVSMVRIGSHPEKLRVVFDGGHHEAPFAVHRLVHMDDGLVVELPESLAELDLSEPPAAADEEPVTVGDADASEETQPAWSEPVDAWEAAASENVDVAPTPEVPEEEGSSRVASVDFESRMDRMSVRVEVSGPASYQLFEPDAETVVLSLPDAILDPVAQARIAPEPGGPISLVMAFQQPDVVHPEVRVVIKRGEALTPKVSRDGSALVLDFQRGVVSAKVPPVLAPDVRPMPDPPSSAPAKALASATAPAAIEPPAALSPEAEGIGILREGGLLGGKQYVGRRISLDFKDVDIDDVLRLIAEVSDLNIIAADNVQGKVTIRLVDVPWDQALDVILLTKGLGFIKVGNVLRIAPQNVLKTEAESRLQERRAKEKLEDLIVKFQPVNYAAVNNVQEMVRRLLTSRGSVNTDTRTNTVIIKDIPSVIDESVALIKAIDTPTPQVLIEAKIVEANLDFTRELGTIWGLGLQRFNDGFDTGSGDRTTDGSSDFRIRPDPRLLAGVTELNNFVVQNPITALPTALFSAGAFLLDEQFNLELQLQAAESTGEGKVISSPRVVTLDNREASIEQGVSIPFQTFENGDAALEFVDAVLQLRVKPHITADRSIIMKLEVSRNAPDDSVAAPGGAPAIAKNQAKTETLVNDGQTLVIGGIYTIQKSDRMSRVPYLHRIPILGMAFRNKLVRDVRKELLIFVTPRIVEIPKLGT